MERPLFALSLLVFLGMGGACTAPSRPQTGDVAVGTSSSSKPMASDVASRMGTKEEGGVVIALNHLSPTCIDVVSATLRDAVTYQEKPAEDWRWVVNGEERVSGSQVFPSGIAKRGDELMAVATFSSGTEAVTIRSRKLLIANALPRVSGITLNNLKPGRGETLRTSATCEDPDGDAVRLTYRWLVNGEVVQEGEKSDYRLDSEKKGDQVHCEVSPHDGRSKGTWSSTPIVEIQNSPPRFLAEPSATSGPDGTFSYRISTEDADGDPVQIELLEGPEGMVLERDTVRWRPGAGFQGEAEVVIRITDGAGGEAQQQFVLTGSSG